MPDYQEREMLSGDPTEAYTPTFDTGGFASQPDPVKPSPASGWGHLPLAGEYPQVAEPEPTVPPEPEPPPAADPLAVVEEAPTSEPIPAPAHPLVVPSAYQYLKRWTFVLVVAGVWIVAAAIGLGLYYWWYQSVDKTPSIFVVLIYLVVCTVGSLLIAMVQNKPLMSALAISMMSAPLASTAAAAALYGAYVFHWIQR